MNAPVYGAFCFEEIVIPSGARNPEVKCDHRVLSTGFLAVFAARNDKRYTHALGMNRREYRFIA
jgi:hypothetical protein